MASGPARDARQVGPDRRDIGPPSSGEQGSKGVAAPVRPAVPRAGFAQRAPTPGIASSAGRDAVTGRLPFRPAPSAARGRTVCARSRPIRLTKLRTAPGWRRPHSRRGLRCRRRGAGRTRGRSSAPIRGRGRGDRAGRRRPSRNRPVCAIRAGAAAGRSRCGPREPLARSAAKSAASVRFRTGWRGSRDGRAPADYRKSACAPHFGAFAILAPRAVRVNSSA